MQIDRTPLPDAWEATKADANPRPARPSHRLIGIIIMASLLFFWSALLGWAAFVAGA